MLLSYKIIGNTRTMKTYLSFLLLLTVWTASAQLPTDFRTEQIYLNPDRHIYLPGDTIGLEGQVTCLTADRWLPYSNYLYVELFDDRDSVLVRQKLSCKDRGYFNTRLPIAYEWPVGVYYLRAYTQLMRNFLPEGFPVQPLLVGKTFPEREADKDEVHCTILSLGGQLVANHPQTLVVRLADACTFPLRDTLYLQNEAGDTLMRVTTSAAGLAQFHFIPQTGIHYSLTGRMGGQDYRFPLPLASSTNVKIQGSLNGKRLHYQVLNGGGDLSAYRVYTFDRRNGLTRLDRIKSSGIILLDESPEVVSLFLTDTQDELLSECALAAKADAGPVALQAPDVLQPGDTLHYQLSGLPAGSRVMARVVAENDLLTGDAHSALTYLSDYTSVLPFPRVSDRVPDDLQAWLCSAHLKRFLLKDLIEKDTAIYVHTPEQVMSFQGTIQTQRYHPFRNGTLVGYHTGNDRVYDADIDGDGHFRMAVDDFAEGERFFLQAVTAKGKTEFAQIQPDDETFPMLQNTCRYRLPRSRYADSETTIDGVFSSAYTVGKDAMRNYVLPDVTVKARLHVELPKETHEYYSTNFTNREKIEERDFHTLLDILRDMPGITVVRGDKVIGTSSDGNGDDENGNGDKGSGKNRSMAGGGEWSIKSNRGVSTFGASSLPILVDNTRIDAAMFDNVLNMAAFEIESVQLLRPWQALAYTFGAIDGAIRVVTRSYRERPDLPSKGTMYQPTGLSVWNAAFVPESHWVASETGTYRLVVDVFTDSDVWSYEHVLNVCK